jgi:hypothetical protein
MKKETRPNAGIFSLAGNPGNAASKAVILKTLRN